ncbi:MAG: cysteine desulfurase [Eggerthellaceae bacterium]|nr:cysteine desulfurase [Eggerthellaceae bacterium]
MLDVARVREDFPILGTQVHGCPLVYLDNSATTQVPECVLDRVAGHYRTSNANVHRGMHYLAHASTSALEGARRTVAAFAGAPSEDGVVFTRGTTDALNMVARGLAYLIQPGDRVVVSVMEHHSNYVPWQQLCAERGARFEVVGLDERGDVDLDELARVLDGGTTAAGGPAATADAAGNARGPVRVVALAGCSNVLGSVLPARRVADMAHAAGALFVLDGAQIMRHGVVDMQALGCDYLAFSGHKMMAGTGIGALVGTMGSLELLRPRDFGGEMVGEVTRERTTWDALPLRLEAGTPNYVGAVALAAACDYLNALGRNDVAAWEDELATHALERLRAIDGLHVLGNPRKRCGLVSFTVDGVHPLDLCTLVDARGVALRSGHNCAQPLLDLFGLTSVARLSPAFYNTREEIDYAAEQIECAVTMLRAAR